MNNIKSNFTTAVDLYLKKHPKQYHLLDQLQTVKPAPRYHATLGLQFQNFMPQNTGNLVNHLTCQKKNCRKWQKI